MRTATEGTQTRRPAKRRVGKGSPSVAPDAGQIDRGGDSGADLDSFDVHVPDTTRLSVAWVAAGVTAILLSAVVGVASGPINLPLHRVLLELIDHLPFVELDSGLTSTQKAIVWEIRTPRVVLGLLVGGLLAGSGASYQGVFRNPLADPYLLGISAGAGFGATIAIALEWGDGAGSLDALPVAAFIGALAAVAATAALSARRGGFVTPATLILAGVAVAAFFAAAQTYVQQLNVDSIREVYAWILGRLSTDGWGEPMLILPYVIVCGAVMIASVGALDILALGDNEARSLGLRPGHARGLVLVAASLATAAAVAVAGLIGFVGLIVPHAVRLVAGVSNRRVVPLSFMFGAAFLTIADVLARTVRSPAELPIGVITAFVGAPFFLAILRSRGRHGQLG